MKNIGQFFWDERELGTTIKHAKTSNHMAITKHTEYVLTVVQHTCCDNCYKLKGKFIDVYNASGVCRGEDSRHWRVQLFAPAQDQEIRGSELPSGFDGPDVPALKLEADGEVVFAVQDAALIDDLMGRLKWMLINHNSNEQIRTHLSQLIQQWGHRVLAGSATAERTSLRPI